jgi:PAS domain S-box-containing protein
VNYPCCDIRDRHQRHLNADGGEIQLRTIIDALPACIAYIDADLRYRFVNQTYAAWFHRDRQTIDGKYLWEVIGTAAYQNASPYIERVFEGRPVTYETVLPYAQGSRHVRATLIPDLGLDARVQGYYALIVDISNYKRTEIKLRCSETALAKAQEIAHIGSWEFDLATQTFDCSDEMFRLFGLAPSASPPSLSQITQFFPTDDWAQVQQAAQQLMATGEPQAFAGHITRPDGESRYLEGSSEAVKNDQGEVVRLLGTAMDVTEHKQRIDQLRLLESVILHANDAVLITEADLIDSPGPRILYANPAFTKMTGYASAEVIGQSPRILQGPKTDRASLDRIRAALKNRQQIRVELLNYHKDGSEFWVEMELVPVTNATGQVTHFVAFQRDVSRRKRNERTLKKQAKLIDIATDAFLVRDLNSRLLFWSRGAEQIYGWQAKEVLGQNVDQLLNPEPSPQVQAAWQAVLRQGEWQGEIVKYTKAKEMRTIESRWTLVRDSTGRPEAVLSVDTDITESKQLEAQFLRAQRLESLGTLASGIAHDLNNILTPILGVAQILPYKLPNAEPSTLELIDILAQSAKRGAALSHQILAFAQGSASNFTAVNIRYLLAEVKRFTRQTFPKSIDIRVSVPSDLWMLMGDATHLYQVLMNLCVNARDAMPDGGVLTLTAQNLYLDENTASVKPSLGLDSGAYVVIEVADTGLGMPPELNRQNL